MAQQFVLDDDPKPDDSGPQKFVLDEPEETFSQKFAKAGYNLNKTIGNIPQTALTSILGAPTDIANFILRANARFGNAVTGESGKPFQFYGGSSDIQQMIAKAKGLPVNELFGAADPNSTTDQVVSGVGTAALTGGRAGVASYTAQSALGAAGAPEDVQAAAAFAAPEAANAVANAPRAAARAALLNKDSAANSQLTSDVSGGNPGTLGMVGNNFAGQLEAILGKSTGGASTVYNAVNSIYSGIRDRYNSIIDNISDVKGAAVAGSSIATGAKAKNEQTRQLTSQVYDEAASRVAPGTEVDVSPFMAASDKATQLIPGDPKLNQDLKGNTQRWVDTQKGQVMDAAIRYGLSKWEQDHGPFTTIDPASVGPADINSTGMSWTPSEVMTLPDGRIVAKSEVQGAIDQIKAKPMLPYETADGIHRLLGQELNDPSLLSRGIDDGIVKQIWGGSKAGLDAALEGTAAGRMRSLADSFYQQKQEERELINPVLTTAATGGPESIFNAAKAAATESGSGTRFREMMTNAGEQGRPVLVATLLDHMGKFDENMTTHTQDAKWSPQTFINNWGKLNGDAKAAVASQLGPDYASAMEQLDRWNSTLVKSKALYSNPSGTAQASGAKMMVATAGASVIQMMAGLGTGNHALAVAGGGGLALVGATLSGAKVVAGAMTSPGTVKWLLATTKMPANALPGAIMQLAQISAQTRDKNGAALAQALQQQLNANQPSASNQ